MALGHGVLGRSRADLRPMHLLRIPDLFDHADFTFEPKLDGFRALAPSSGIAARSSPATGTCSGGGRNSARNWRMRCGAEPRCSTARSAARTLTGGPTSYLLFRRERPYFYAFDLLMLNGRDLPGLPLIERKRPLNGIMPAGNGRVLLLDSMVDRHELFDAGHVGVRRSAPKRATLALV
jgi:bifunctional non-homologous end joining protein LigD